MTPAKLPSLHECGPQGIWALLVQPAPDPGDLPTVILWKGNNELSPIACDPSYSLPRLSRLSISMSSIGVMVEESAWLFLGHTPAGAEIWSAFPLMWVQSPPPPQLVSLPPPVLGQVLATGVVDTSSSLPALGPAAPVPGEQLSIPSWLAQLLTHLDLVRDLFR